MRRTVFSQDGIALPLVMVLIAVVTILGFTAAYVAGNQGMLGARFAQGEKALAIAEAGVNQYLWHLNKDPRFYEHDDDFILDGGQPRVHTFEDGQYRLEITPPTTAEPVVTIRCTGWLVACPSERKTLQVRVRRRQFVQYVSLCNEQTSPDGEPVYWYTGDHIWGPLHTNGTLRIWGRPTFHDRVTYSGGLELRNWSHPEYKKGPPEKVAPLVFPSSNSQLKTHALNNGYYYRGRTCILLRGSQLKIRNRDNPVETRPLPPNGVIYVDGAAASGTEESKWDPGTGNVFVSGELDGRLTIGAASDIYITAKDPTNFNYLLADWTGGIRYSNQDFDPEGGMTDDMLGLVANGYVRILHYNWPSGRPSDWPLDLSPWYWPIGDVAPYDITIQAAIFAVEWGAYEFEDYDKGLVKGHINLTGSVCQRYTGATGTALTGGIRLTGYLENNRHDPRMDYDSPPHFLEPLNSGWEIIDWSQRPG